MRELGLLVDSLEIFEKFITDVMEAERIIIFGASGGGRRAIKILEELGKKPMYFVDNDSSKWGGKVEGIKVLSPSELKRIDFDIIVVASSIGEAEIISQLEEMGYEGKTYTLAFVRLLLWAKRFFRKLKVYFFE